MVPVVGLQSLSGVRNLHILTSFSLIFNLVSLVFLSLEFILSFKGQLIPRFTSRSCSHVAKSLGGSMILRSGFRFNFAA
jgi:hypothetical protein